MALPRALLAINAVKARLAAIKTADGFNTDAGENVLHGPVHVNEASKIGIVVSSSNEVVQQAQTGGSTGNGVNRFVTTQLDITITGYVLADPTEEKGIELELLLADIKRAGMLTAKSGLSSIGLPTQLDSTNGIGPLQYLRTDKTARPDGQKFEQITVICAVTINELYGDPYHAK